LQQSLPKLGPSLDGMAIALSAACVIHCLLLPVLIILFPILGSTVLADESFHRLLLVLIIPSSALAFYLGCRQHGDGSVLWLGLTGILLITLAAAVGVAGLGAGGEKLLTGAGGALLASGHVINFRRCRARRCEEQSLCHEAGTGT
jgi:glucose-6-phosphate-specific signal transduction histidine kinase